MPTSQKEFEYRRMHLSTFIHTQVVSAERLVETLREIESLLRIAAETPEEKFAEGLAANQNFMRNVDFSQAVKLAARCGAAEQRNITG